MSAKEKTLYPMRIEELPTIGEFLYTALVRDVLDFVPYTAFDSPFPGDFKVNLGLVSEAVNPFVLTSQLKLVTFNMLNGVYSLRESINQAEIFFITTGSALNVKPKDMGQHAVRVAIGRGDVEALVRAMRTLNQNIAFNSTALIAKGFLLAMQTALVDATNKISDDNIAQNTLRQQRASTTASNKKLYNDFWTIYMSPTATTGKLIYKVANATKAKDYTIAQLKARTRADQKQTEVHGIVTNLAGLPQDKAKVKLIPIDGGRTKTVYTDKGGKYSMNGMKATDYNMVVTSAGLVKVIAVTVITRQHIEVNAVVV